MTSNIYKDCIDVKTVHKWSREFLGTTPEDNYNVPLKADPEWWSSLKVNDVCIVAGRNEVFLDDIVKFAKKMKVGTMLKFSSLSQAQIQSHIYCCIQVGREDVEFSISDGETHDSPVSDTILGFLEGAMIKTFCQWLMEHE
ncbi:hypothetical protein LTR10_024440 [Elasticomyces elasticus]|uniref:NmrA-like domain-containing protein n=1 Tax=Exophiala sideris TaxID=1016849 RepID=A0ABR0IU51_9EURO|nr:hypothetical protein LTR10_024440 [Elasticomyces elasticus]KAK5020773.1 hypothetical protein LTS07_011446 [Exophiala sideris]KAK5022719.1 hypothetical protein LTR13_011419 [Exophiala sideris]KAK5048118.1 hypothetical protein LTR69_011451 [Exophiala sideris]KAK5175946.1 hypothetical protein LTR44_011497 [Eurotiomycetes sp. CCFEE 6388]